MPTDDEMLPRVSVDETTNRSNNEQYMWASSLDLKKKKQKKKTFTYGPALAATATHTAANEANTTYKLSP